MILVAFLAPPRAPQGAPRTPPSDHSPSKDRHFVLSDPSRTPKRSLRSLPDGLGDAPRSQASPQGPSRAPPGASNVSKHYKNQWFFNGFQSCQAPLNSPMALPQDPPSDPKVPPGASPRYPKDPPAPLWDPSGTPHGSKGPPRAPLAAPQGPQETSNGPPRRPQRPPTRPMVPQGPPQPTPKAS